jgi:hypothetical protein
MAQRQTRPEAMPQGMAQRIHLRRSPRKRRNPELPVDGYDLCARERQWLGMPEKD